MTTAALPVNSPKSVPSAAAVSEAIVCQNGAERGRAQPIQVRIFSCFRGNQDASPGPTTQVHTPWLIPFTPWSVRMTGPTYPASAYTSCSKTMSSLSHNSSSVKRTMFRPSPTAGEGRTMDGEPGSRVHSLLRPDGSILCSLCRVGQVLCLCCALFVRRESASQQPRHRCHTGSPASGFHCPFRLLHYTH